MYLHDCCYVLCKSARRTFVRHLRACLQVELLAAAAADLLDVVAQGVAAILATVQADAFVKDAVVPAPVGHALLVLVQQGVDEQMDGSLVSAFHRLLETYVRKHEREDI